MYIHTVIVQNVRPTHNSNRELERGEREGKGGTTCTQLQHRNRERGKGGTHALSTHYLLLRFILEVVEQCRLRVEGVDKVPECSVRL